MCLLILCFVQTTKRAGWVKRGIQDPESIGDHMYRMGLMALISSDMPGVNRDKLVCLFVTASSQLFPVQCCDSICGIVVFV